MRTFAQLFLAAILGAALVAGGLYRPYEPSFEVRMRAEAAPTVRLLKGDAGGACSAVVIAPGHALTALHCKPMGAAKVDGHPVAKWREFSAKDVAIIVAPGLKCPCALVGVAPVAGDQMSAIGFPYAVGLLISYGEAQGDVIVDGERYAHHTAATDSGMSGGGVFAIQHSRVVLVAITSKGSRTGNSAISVIVDGLQPQLRGL